MSDVTVTVTLTDQERDDLRFVNEMCAMRVAYYEKTTSRTGTRNRFERARAFVYKLLVASAENTLGQGTVPSPLNNNPK